LILGGTDFLRKQLEECPFHKFVIVLTFIRHFDYLTEALADLTPVLVLNGETPMTERSEVISKFQQNDLEYRVIAISAEVGSVGIELDDKDGKYPRHMICLPMTNGVNFCQAIGRIQRTKTQSHSRVTVVQPNKAVTTYFKSQITRKFQVLGQFMTVPEFKNYYEPTPEPEQTTEAESEPLEGFNDFQ
jgi:superfamily II DNA or RNA helicase